MEESKSPEANQIVQLSSPTPRNNKEISILKNKKFWLILSALILITLAIALPFLLKSSRLSTMESSKVFNTSPSLPVNSKPPSLPLNSKSPSLPNSKPPSMMGNYACLDKGSYFQLENLDGIACVLPIRENAKSLIPVEGQVVVQKSAYASWMNVKVFAKYDSITESCEEIISTVFCVSSSPSLSPTQVIDHEQDDMIEYQNSP
jgi:hypothetical protein